MGYFYSDKELAHHGIKGQKWGVRRFQRPDGTLTPKGKKRLEARENAIQKVSNLKKYAEEDAAKYLSSYNKPLQITEHSIKKRLRDDFGNGDKEYLDKMASDYGYKNAKDYAVGELKRDHEDYLKNSKKAEEYAKRCDVLIKHYSDTKVSDISKDDLKTLKKLSKSYYSFVWDLDNPYNEVNKAYSKIQNK